MRGDAGSMTVLRPRTAAEAVRLFAKAPQALPLAGGTDLMVAWNTGALNGRTVLDLGALREWSRIVRKPASLVAGALVTHASLRDHPSIRKQYPLLARACAEIGGVAIQNRGTLGGNIANASPAGDTFPALAVYDARVHLTGPDGRRLLPVLELLLGVKKTALGPAELIESVELPRLERRPARQYFRKVGTRAAQALSKTVAAGLLWLDRKGRVAELRFALGSMAPTVRRLKAAEAFVAGKRLTREAVDEACRLLARDVAPIDDVRSTAGYRLRVSQNLLREFLLR